MESSLVKCENCKESLDRDSKYLFCCACSKLDKLGESLLCKQCYYCDGKKAGRCTKSFYFCYKRTCCKESYVCHNGIGPYKCPVLEYRRNALRNNEERGDA